MVHHSCLAIIIWFFARLLSIQYLTQHGEHFCAIGCDWCNEKTKANWIEQQILRKAEEKNKLQIERKPKNYDVSKKLYNDNIFLR